MIDFDLNIILQIFLLVIIFGLFFGLVFLPVILSLFGPAEWHTHSDNYEMATSPSHNDNKRRINKNNNDADDKEMVSFIRTANDKDTNGKNQNFS